MTKEQIKKYSSRISELRTEGRFIASLEKPTKQPNIKTIQDSDKLIKWFTNVENIISVMFHKSNFQYQTFLTLKNKKTYYSSVVMEICGLLDGIKNDIDSGFLYKHELILSAQLFENVLDQSKELLKKDYLRASIVLLRVVVEGCLRKLCENNEIEILKENKRSYKSANDLNIELKKTGIYDEARSKEIQSWLDFGNKAAHPNEIDTEKERIENIIKNIELFTDELLK